MSWFAQISCKHSMLLIVMGTVRGMSIDWLEGVAPAAKVMDLGLMTGLSKDSWAGHMV